MSLLSWIIRRVVCIEFDVRGRFNVLVGVWDYQVDDDINPHQYREKEEEILQATLIWVVG